MEKLRMPDSNIAFLNNLFLTDSSSPTGRRNRLKGQGTVCIEPALTKDNNAAKRVTDKSQKVIGVKSIITNYYQRKQRNLNFDL